MPEYQWLANLVLMCLFLLAPAALGTMLAGRWSGNRLVLRWARVLAVLTIVLAVGYDVGGAVCLLLAEPTPGHPPWSDPSAATKYPYFYLPIGVGAFLAGLGTLVAVVRARHRLG